MEKPTNDQAKLEAIKKAYIDLFNKFSHEPDGNNSLQRFLQIKISIDKHGWLCGRLHNIPDIELDFSGHECRPKSLEDIENNNGWIRIEPDGSNLPDKYTMNYKTGRFNQDGRFDVDSKEYGVNFVEKRFYSSLITHYKPIEQEPLPIW